MQRLLGRDGSTFPIERLREALEVNVVGTFMVMCHAAQSMARQPPVDGDGQRGVVINVASLAGLEGSVGQTAYGAAKAAVVGMTLPAARDLGPVGIRVVTIAPGGITPNGQADESEPVEARLLEQTPFPRRFGTPEEFSDMVAAIIDNAYINATTLRLDGGLRLPRR
jgi:NAD(P)-dependent dehydrogenase (short-subunit alcohol dehydrogenase family)